MSTNSAFSIRSRKVTERFLQSAVIVDDQAHLGREPRAQTVVTPGRGTRTQATAGPEPPLREPGAVKHDLDAKQLIDAFAELGIVCAVLKPDLGSAGFASTERSDTIESLSIRTDRATKRADIVILDWNIPDEERPGQNAKRLIQKILATDEPIPRTDDYSRRLRLVAIYTGDENLDSITNELDDLLQQLQPGSTVRGTYRVTAGPVTIVVYGKGRPTIAGVDAERRVSEEKLPERLRDEFSKMTEGLLSNAALEALSALRTNTHRILSRFNPGVDAPYVAHRAMMQPPEEAEEHPVPLIAAEIEGVLADDSGIPELVGLPAIVEWLDHIELGDGAIPAHLKMTADAFKTALLYLLEHGVEETAKHASNAEWKELMTQLNSYDRRAVSIITQALAPEGKEGTKLDMEFARLTSLRSQYNAPPPILKLGTIVAEDEEKRKKYWLCVQPVCDSVRITKPRFFPFLKLKEKLVTDPGPIDFVVTDQGEFKCLRYSRKAFDMQLFDMAPANDTETVEATRKGDHWLFEAFEGKPILRWIADLKTDHAHRVVDEFANEIKRVGLTESEWLRRMARKKIIA